MCASSALGCLLKIFQNHHERFVEKFSMEFLSHVGWKILIRLQCDKCALSSFAYFFLWSVEALPVLLLCYVPAKRLAEAASAYLIIFRVIFQQFVCFSAFCRRSLSLVASTAACNLNNFQLYSPLQVQLFTLFVSVHFPILSLLHARAAASVALFDLSTE